MIRYPFHFGVLAMLFFVACSQDRQDGNRQADAPRGRIGSLGEKKAETPEMATVFSEFDLSDFWEQSDYADEEYVDDPLTDEKVVSVERALGYRLPRAYIELMKHQNGGIPKRTNHRTEEATSWAHDHVAIAGIHSIGSTKPNSLCGSFSSQFWIDEWGYPPIGVYFADCPSAGHDMICLDYRKCSPTGEPQVVHVDQESDYRITFVAKDFESFVRGLEGDEAFEE